MPVFVTNAHCTGLIGKDESTDFYSRYYTPEDLIGNEYADPSYASGAFATTDWGAPCNTDGTGYYCRRSDMALVQTLVSSGSVRLGYIARPSFYRYGLNAMGSLKLDPDKGPLKITGEDNTPEMNQALGKVGIASGWTWGNVRSTCTDYILDLEGADRNPENLVIRCGTDVGANSDQGDSGAPMFDWNGDTVVLYGINFGETTDGGRLFSSIGLIRADLDALNNPSRFKTFNP